MGGCACAHRRAGIALGNLGQGKMGNRTTGHPRGSCLFVPASQGGVVLETAPESALPFAACGSPSLCSASPLSRAHMGAHPHSTAQLDELMQWGLANTPV